MPFAPGLLLMLSLPSQGGSHVISLSECRRHTERGYVDRHNDLLDPVWNMFDLAPEGCREFQPKLDYTSGPGK